MAQCNTCSVELGYGQCELCREVHARKWDQHRRVAELPHPEGWTYLGQSEEDRLLEVAGAMVTLTFRFNNYRKADEDGRMHLMMIQVFE